MAQLSCIVAIATPPKVVKKVVQEPVVVAEKRHHAHQDPLMTLQVQPVYPYAMLYRTVGEGEQQQNHAHQQQQQQQQQQHNQQQAVYEIVEDFTPVNNAALNPQSQAILIPHVNNGQFATVQQSQLPRLIPVGAGFSGNFGPLAFSAGGGLHPKPGQYIAGGAGFGFGPSYNQFGAFQYPYGSPGYSLYNYHQPTYATGILPRSADLVHNNYNYRKVHPYNNYLYYHY